MKNLWGYISYAWFVLMLIIVGFFSGSLNVNAETLSSSQYNLYTNDMTTDNCSGSVGLGYKNLDTSTDTRGVPAYARVDYLTDVAQLTTGNTYSFSVVQSFNPKVIPEQIDLTKFTYSIEGSTSTSTSGLSPSNVSNVSCITIDVPNNNYQTKTLCSFTAKASIRKLFVRVNFNCHVEYIDYFNTYTMRIDLEDSTTNAINNQTTIINNSINNQTNAINNIDNTMKDDSIDDPDDMISDFEDLIATNGVITNLIALPISLYSKILNSINCSCSSFNLGSLYGTNLIMPCIELTDYLGSSLVNTIDLMISGFFIYAIAKKMIKAFENFTGMKEGDVIDD